MQIQQAARLLLGLSLAVNGIAMLAAPANWYALTPGVSGTGPLNLHFVRDIGCAYLVSGTMFLWLWRNPNTWPAAMAGTLFLALHGLVHVGEAMAGVLDLHHLARDVPGVILIPILAVWLAWPPTTKENDDVTMDGTASPRRL